MTDQDSTEEWEGPIWRVEGWFDPVLICVNDARGNFSYSIKFRLPGLSGDWRNSHNVKTWTNNWNKRKARSDIAALLRPILQAIVENRGTTKETWDELSELVGEIPLKGSTCLAQVPGEFLTTGYASVANTTQWLALLVADLINRGLDSRLRICELPSCDDYFVAWKTRGPMQRYCSRSHGSQHRVQRKRKADQRRRLS